MEQTSHLPRAHCLHASDVRRAPPSGRGSVLGLRATIDLARIGIAHFDLNGQVLLVNDRLCEILGRSREDVLTCTFTEILFDADLFDCMAPSSQLSAGNAASGCREKRFVRGDGSTVWSRVTVSAVRDAKGDVAFFVGIADEIGNLMPAEIERKRLSDFECDARTQAERETRSRDDLLAVVAHDLRTPLHTIAVGLETLLKLQPPNDERAARQLVIMQRTVGNMNRLILDLLDVTRIEGGNFVVARERVEVQPLLTEVLERFEAPARERGISLTCNAPEGVHYVIGERDRLIQVLSNLIGNAVKFTPRHGRISVHAQLLEEAVRFSVEDTGPGIPSASLPQLFDRFWQADRTGRSGTGLGLPIAKAIVEAHGGRIWAESLLGQGTTFHFTVPCAAA
jgi:PAS domain S-box-containing protein